jgi:hypothetical protein
MWISRQYQTLRDGNHTLNRHNPLLAQPAPFSSPEGVAATPAKMN